MAVAAPVAENQQGGAAIERGAVLLEERAEHRPVVGIRVDVEQTSGGQSRHQGAQRRLGVLLGEDVGGLDDIGDERPAAHLGHQRLQTVDDLQGEPGRCSHRQ